MQSHCWKDPDEAKVYRSILSKEQIYDFLAGLTPSLDDVCGRILGFKPLPCLDAIFEQGLKFPIYRRYIGYRPLSKRFLLSKIV